MIIRAIGRLTMLATIAQLFDWLNVVYEAYQNNGSLCILTAGSVMETPETCVKPCEAGL